MKKWFNDNNTFINCDFTKANHCEKVCDLINEYLADKMGGGKPIVGLRKLHLLDGLESHPRSIVYFILYQNKIAGILIGFMNFSTFLVKPMINIHDVFVSQAFRGKGLGRKLIEKIIEIGVKNNCGKITLEVRKDNKNAQSLYWSEGFGQTNPPMFFWTKELSN